MTPAPGAAAALGLSPHSGWAILVAVTGSPAAPEVLLRIRIEMADPRLHGSKQPYHAIEAVSRGDAARHLKRFEETAREMAYDSLRAAVDDLCERGHMPKAAGILASSGRQGSSLESILASHALIHTADGEHFREALAHACNRCGIAAKRVPARNLLDEAGRVIGKSADHLKNMAKTLGQPLGPPWDADCKSATLLAWMLLAGK